MKSQFIVFKGGRIVTPQGVRRADVLVDEKSGEAVSGDSYVRDFEEYWTFVREGGEWKLAAIDDSMAGAGKVREENVDEGTSKDMLQWYYTKDRAL